MAARRALLFRQRLAVLCSGQGTNLQALLDAAKAGRLGGAVALVISDRPGAYALTRAKRAGVETALIEQLRESIE